MRVVCPLFLVQFLLLQTGCCPSPAPQSRLVVAVTQVEWYKQDRHPHHYQTTIWVPKEGPTTRHQDSEHSLTFDGIHDFKAGKQYEIFVKQHTAELVSWKEVGTEPDLSKPFRSSQ